MDDMKNHFSVFHTRYGIIETESPTPLDDGASQYAVCKSQEYVIELTRTTVEGKPIPTSEREKMLVHEIVHAILNEGAYTDESNNERLVEWLARNVYDILIVQDVLHKQCSGDLSR